MKHLSAIACAILVLLSMNSFAWGPDILVDTTNIPCNLAVVQGPNGDLHMAIPDPVANDGVAVRFLISMDQGATWQNLGWSGTGNGVPSRVRLVAGTNAVWGAYLVDTLVHVIDLATGTVSTYNDHIARDFDVVMSSSGWMYLYLQLYGTNSIRRAGTNDAGATWTGNTALVTGGGSDPRLSISAGDTVIVNYYGPVLTDKPKSIVRQGMYYESAPGTLTVTGIGFDDILTNTTIDKWQFGSVQSGGVVWTFWSEGVGSRDIKAVVSTNGGDTYGGAINVAADAGVDEFAFHAVRRTQPGQVGVDLVFARYTAGGSTDQVYHSRSASATPTTFMAPVQVSEFSPLPFPSTFHPQACAFSDHSVGAAWLGGSGGAPDVFWDHDSFSVGVSFRDAEKDLLLHPNPTNGALTLVGTALSRARLVRVHDVQGRLVRSIPVEAATRMTLDLSDLPPGVHVLEVLWSGGRSTQRFVKQ